MGCDVALMSLLIAFLQFRFDNQKVSEKLVGVNGADSPRSYLTGGG